MNTSPMEIPSRIDTLRGLSAPPAAVSSAPSFDRHDSSGPVAMDVASPLPAVSPERSATLRRVVVVAVGASLVLIAAAGGIRIGQAARGTGDRAAGLDAGATAFAARAIEASLPADAPEAAPAPATDAGRVRPPSRPTPRPPAAPGRVSSGDARGRSGTIVRSTPF